MSRLFVRDPAGKHTYLVDGGSKISAPPLPGQKYRRGLVPNITLSAANGSTICVYGTAQLNVNFGLTNPFTWNFVVADVSHPIIGADFLEHYHLLPDLKRKRLVDGKLLLSAKGFLQHTNQPSISCIHSESENKRVTDLLKKYRSITLQPQYHKKPPHDVVHHIETEGPPISEKPRRLRPEMLLKVQAEFREMEAQGIV